MTGRMQSAYGPFGSSWAWLTDTLPALSKLPAAMAVTALLLVVSGILRPFDRRGRGLERLTILWATTMLRIARIRMRTEGIDRLDLSQRYVFVCNHASWVDIPVLITSLPHRLTFLAKRELFEMPLLGACLRRTGQIPVDRSNSRKSADGLRKTIEAVRTGRYSLLLFAGGTRADSGVGEFKQGAAYLAIRAQLPVVPVGLKGTAAVMPRGARLIRGTTVEVVVGDPIPTQDLTVEQRADLTRKLQEEVHSMVTGAPTQVQRAAAAAGSSAC